MSLTATLMSLSLLVAGCGSSSSGGGGGSSGSSAASSGIPVGPPEATYYGNDNGSNYINPSIASQISSGPTYTITGKARYYYRSNSTGSVTGPSDIRRAEVRVSNSSGTVMVGTETNNTGNFSFTIPADNQTYTVTVTSRASNTYSKISVLNKPENNQYYSISKTFVASSTQNIGNIDAAATGSVVGGAFYIYDQLLKSNEYLSTNTSSCGSTYTGCSSFPGATGFAKVVAYWTLGFNPGSYFNVSPVSFTTQSNGSTLVFILGGLNGNYTNTDTDHWDNSVIIHEYAHFLEYAYAGMDSPGGTHTGTSPVDARLAWSEGWSNFFQAAVRGATDYVDMSSVDSGTPQTLVNVNLSTQSRDVPVNNGEGVFREFSITRQLLTFISSPNSFPFLDLWVVFSGNSVQPSGGGTAVSAFKSTNLKFRNIGTFWKVQQQLNSSRNIASSIITAELSAADRTYYDTPVQLASGCTTTGTLTGAGTSTYPGNPATANRWYYFNHSGGSFSLQLTCSACTASDDLDLYVYNQSYVLGNSSTLAGSSRASNSGGVFVAESVSRTLSAGAYMVNVSRYSGSMTRSFTLTFNGQTVCPNP
jgi:hypothetical protein